MKHCVFDKKCGGCEYIHVPYEEQLAAKRKYVQDLFPDHTVEDVIGMKDPYHYRHKVYASFYLDRKGKMHAGLYQEHSHKRIDSVMCLIQNKTANDILHEMCVLAEAMKIPVYDEDRETGVLRHAYIRVSEATGNILLVIVIGGKSLPSSRSFVKALTEKFPKIRSVVLNYNHDRTSMVLGRKEDILYGKGYITDSIGGIDFRISSRSFYQVNPLQTEVLYAKALELADLKESDTVLDACCGIGTITLLAAKQCRYAYGVEINPQAIRDAIENAKQNNIRNVYFKADDAGHFITSMKEKPDVIIMDPPRSGMSEEFLDTACRMKPSRMVYVSCNPETQARDAAYLLKRGYHISRIIPVDNFPFTKHVETVCCLYHKKNDFISVPYEPKDADYLKQLK